MSKFTDRLIKITENLDDISLDDKQFLYNSFPLIIEMYNLAKIIKLCSFYDLEGGCTVCQGDSLDKLDKLMEKFEALI